MFQKSSESENPNPILPCQRMPGGVMLIVGPERGSPSELVRICEAAILGGITSLQFRAKPARAGDLTPRWEELEPWLTPLLSIIATAKIPLIINDNVELAAELIQGKLPAKVRTLATATTVGVHVGQDDMSAQGVRDHLVFAIIGLTVKNAPQANALPTAVDYASIGGVFPTQSKRNPDPPIGLKGFHDLCTRIRERRGPDFPIYAIAGINALRARQLAKLGASGIAVMDSILRASNPEAATRELVASLHLRHQHPRLSTEVNA